MSTFKDGPRAPTSRRGLSQFGNWVRSVHERVFGGRFPLLDSPTLKWQSSPRGYIGNVVPQPQVTSSVPKNLQPFSIYQISNFTNPSLSWLTFQIRNGYVAWRSLKGMDYALGNAEQYIFCSMDNAGTQFDLPASPNQGPIVELVNGVDTTIRDSSQPLPGLLPQIVLNSQRDAFGQINASFWIEIVDNSDVTNNDFETLYFRLKGRMWTGNPFDGTGRQTSAFPDPDPTVIPLGQVSYLANSQSPQISQFQWGNLINRMLPTAPAAAAGKSVGRSPMQYRGMMKQDNLDGEVFYPGDLVVDDTGDGTLITPPTPGSSAGIYLFDVYMYVESVPQQWSGSLSGADQYWQIVFSRLLFHA